MKVKSQQKRWIDAPMTDTQTFFTYYHPITVRYGDLDPQGHVNNAAYLTYLESARLGYYEKTGIWSSQSGQRTGMVVAHIAIDYLQPLFLHQGVCVGLRLARLGQKSLTLDFQIEAGPSASPAARGQSVMVAFDHTAQKSMPIPPAWRENIHHFEKTDGKP
jgi:acyl-CoA thioester hydrolase